jgi:hypothetical protein
MAYAAAASEPRAGLSAARMRRAGTQVALFLAVLAALWGFWEAFK